MQTITLQPGESVTVTAAGSTPPIPPDPPTPPPSDVKLYPLAIPNLTQTLVTITQGVRTNDVVSFQITTPMSEPVQLKASITFISGPVTSMYCAFNETCGDFSNEEPTGTYISLVLKAPIIAPGRTYYLNIRYENPQDDNNADLSMQFTHYG